MNDKKNHNIIKTQDDHQPVFFDAVDGEVGCFKLSEDISVSWINHNDKFDIKILRSRIEPWLTALFQSEHLSLLAGSGLTHAVHYLAAGKGAAGMATVKWPEDFADAIKKKANASADKTGRKKGNLEDQLRIANELLRGLEKPGLILANQGETLEDYLKQIPDPSFSADDDNVIPMLDDNWFSDDITQRFCTFLRVTFGEEHYEENLKFIEQAIGKSIRAYFLKNFYTDHVKRYKKRPIYWLFSSGKHKAFECLIYLHRYNTSTLARMRTEYVIPLTSKFNSHIEKLEQDREVTESAAEVKKIEKELQTLHKKQAELSTFDEKLRHCADQRIELNLDDGVKVNYGKFGDLLADVKAVTGKKA